jgi:hypothetical protein
MNTPPLKPCKECGSLDCGPVRCRFEDTHWRDEDPSDEDWHRKEIEIHPERYR